MELTNKQLGYAVQALVEVSLEKRRSGDDLNGRKMFVTAKKVLLINSSASADGFKALDEEQLVLITEALEERARHRELFGTRFDCSMMLQTAELVRSYKMERESSWIKSKVQEGMAFEAAI